MILVTTKAQEQTLISCGEHALVIACCAATLRAVNCVSTGSRAAFERAVNYEAHTMLGYVYVAMVHVAVPCAWCLKVICSTFANEHNSVPVLMLISIEEYHINLSANHPFHVVACFGIDAVRCLILSLSGTLFFCDCAETTRVVQVATRISPGSVIALGGNSRIWSEGAQAYADTMSRSRYKQWVSQHGHNQTEMSRSTAYRRARGVGGGVIAKGGNQRDAGTYSIPAYVLCMCCTLVVG